MSTQDGTCSEGNAQQGYPSLCKNGCGFFSSVDSKGFCSVCYKDFLKKEQSSTETNSTEEVAATTASMSNLNVSVDESKKVGLTGFACRCGGMFCGIHRYSDKHDCTFDYGALGKSEIAAANPVIVAEKVAKI